MNTLSATTLHRSDKRDTSWILVTIQTFLAALIPVLAGIKEWGVLRERQFSIAMLAITSIGLLWYWARVARDRASLLSNKHIDQTTTALMTAALYRGLFMASTITVLAISVLRFVA